MHEKKEVSKNLVNIFLGKRRYGKIMERIYFGEKGDIEKWRECIYFFKGGI